MCLSWSLRVVGTNRTGTQVLGISVALSTSQRESLKSTDGGDPVRLKIPLDWLQKVVLCSYRCEARGETSDTLTPYHTHELLYSTYPVSDITAVSCQYYCLCSPGDLMSPQAEWWWWWWWCWLPLFRTQLHYLCPLPLHLLLSAEPPPSLISVCCSVAAGGHGSSPGEEHVASNEWRLAGSGGETACFVHFCLLLFFFLWQCVSAELVSILLLRFPSIHPLSSSYLGSGCGGSRLSRVFLDSLFPSNYTAFKVLAIVPFW